MKARIFNHNFKSLFAIVFAMLLLSVTSCDRTQILEPALNVDSVDLTFQNEGGISSFMLSSNEQWDITLLDNSEESDQWITISPLKGNAGSDITVTVYTTPNDRVDYLSRNCTLQIRTASGATRNIEIKQEKVFAVLSEENSVELSSYEQILEIEVQSGVTYDIDISEEYDWISEMEQSESENIHTFAIAKNESFEQREGVIVFTSKENGASDEFSIIQRGMDVGLPSDAQYINYERQTFEVKIYNNLYMEPVIKQGAEWVELVEKSEDEEFYTFTFEAQMNYQDDARSAIIWFEDKEMGTEYIGVYMLMQGHLEDIGIRSQRILCNLYESTNGDGWINNENWCTDKPVSEWYGIKTNEEGYITEISLPSNNLTGTLPQDMQNLRYTATLDLSNNAIEGSLEYLELATGYVSIDLSNNNFSGKFPYLGYSQSLEFVDFSNNEIEDNDISYQLGGTTPYLILNNNKISGPLPFDQKGDFGKYALGIIRQRPNSSSYNGFDFTRDIYLPQIDIVTISGDNTSLRKVYENNNLTMLVYINPKDEGSMEFLDKSVNRFHSLYSESGLGVVVYIPQGEEYSSIMKDYVAQNDVKYTVVQEYYDENGDFIYLPEDPAPGYLLIDMNGKVLDDIFEGGIEYINTCWQEMKLQDNGLTNFDYLNNLIINEMGIRNSSYISSDFSMDGEFETIQNATVGKGIDLVFMGDAFTDVDIKSGFYRQIMEQAVEAFFDSEPTKSYRDYFNVHIVYAVSDNPFLKNNLSALGTYVENDEIKGDVSIVREYAQKAAGNSVFFPVVIVNNNYERPSEYMDVDGINYSYVGYMPGWLPNLSNAIRHSFVGHTFGKLADESHSPAEITAKEVENLKEWQAKGYYLNVSTTAAENDVPWAHLLKDSRFDYVSVEMGGYGYLYGVWRSHHRSIMESPLFGAKYFNTACRELIVKQIMEQAGLEYDFETFVSKDNNGAMVGWEYTY